MTTRPLRTPHQYFAALAAALVLAGCGASTGDERIPTALLEPLPPDATLEADATVEHVIDGDTIVARIGENRVRVRLLGIDTPETVSPRTPVECFGPQASARLTKMLGEGASVVVQVDPRADRHDMYGRLLAYVTLVGERQSVNAMLLRDGFADIYIFDRAQPFSRAGRFRQLRDAAVRHRRGMWGACPQAEPRR